MMIEQIYLSPQVKESMIFSTELVHRSYLIRFERNSDLGLLEIRKNQENLETWKN